MRIEPRRRGCVRRASRRGRMSGDRAGGIHDIVNENMASAARVAHRQARPRAASLHADGDRRRGPRARVSRRAHGIRASICPPGAGAGSAMGMLMAPARIDRVAHYASRSTAPTRGKDGNLPRSKLRHGGARGHGRRADRRLPRLADMRYTGQGSEIAHPLPSAITRDAMRAEFREGLSPALRAHAARCRDPVRDVRVSVSAPVPGAGGALISAPSERRRAEGQPAGVFRRGGMVETPVYDRYALSRGDAAPGPRCSRRTRARSSSVPAPRASAARRHHLAEGEPRVTRRRFDPIELELLWTRLISADRRGGGGARAHLVLDAGARILRFLLHRHRRIGPVAGAGDAEHPVLHRHAARDGEALPRRYPVEKLKPGDVLITNDMYQGTGHLPDIKLGKPIFHEGRMIGYAATTAHAPDIGGKIRSPEPREVFEEGLQIPIMKMIDAARSTTRWSAHPQERAHARPDDGRPVGAGRRARRDGGAHASRC